MFRSFLLIGLGGSGGKTLRFAKEEIRVRLREAGWQGGIPDAWQFLHIDTPTNPDGNELNNRVPQIGIDEYLGLVGSSVTFDAVAATLDNTPGMAKEMAGWRINPNLLEVPIGMGAGQFRAVGRTVAMVQGQQIRNRLTTMFQRASSPSAQAELAECFAATTSKGAATQDSGAVSAAVKNEPIVIVISSLAGGTGAGLIMNVCDMIEESGDSEGVFGFFYTPEVFGAKGGVGDGVFPNSLAAISEVVNGHLWNGDPGALTNQVGRKVPPRSNADLVRAGAATPLKSGGPSFPFLIGLENENGNKFASDTDLFSALGSALATTMSDVELNDQLFAYEITNWQQNAQSMMGHKDVLVSGYAEKLETQGPPCFQGLGTARLSIGLSFFEEYSAQRMAKDAAREMALSHMSSDSARRVAERFTTNDPIEIAGHLAEGLLEHFLTVTQLSELGPDENLVKDALRPDEATIAAILGEARSEAYRLGEIGSGGTTDAAGWQNRLSSAVQQASVLFNRKYLEALKASVHTWSEQHPHHVLEVVEDFISRHGIVVTSELVRRSVLYLNGETGVVEELKGINELGAYNHWSSEEQVRQAIAAPLEGLGARVDSGHAALAEACEVGIRHMSYAGEAHLCQFAAALLDSFASGFLRPLAAALAAEAQEIDSELAGVAANWAEWTEETPPPSLLPPLSEVTLITKEEFAPLFGSLVAASYPDEPDAEARRRRLRGEILSGSFLRNSDEADASVKAVAISVGWSPGTAVDPDQMRPQSDAYFKLALTPQRLMERSRSWMHQPNSEFHKLLSSSLRSYLQDDPIYKGTIEREELRRRQERFKSKLSETFSVASPLVGLNSGLVGQIHNTQFHGIRSSVSTLPFSNHELQQSVTAIVNDRLGYDGAQLNNDDHTSHITVMQRFKGAVSPLVVESLLRPISEDWSAKRLTGVGRGQFWSRRRARRLEEFVPVTQEVLAAMCRGWFVGVALGIIDRSSTPIQIGRPNDPPAAFPEPTLSASSSSRDQLAVVLESLSIAYVEVGRLDSTEPLSSYCRLRDLGTRGMANLQNLYGFEPDDGSRLLGSDLEEWLDTGQAPGQLVKPKVQGDSAESRLDALSALLEDSIRQYRSELEELEESWRRDPQRIGLAPNWAGISQQVLDALSMLYEAVKARRASGDAEDGELL